MGNLINPYRYSAGGGSSTLLDGLECWLALEETGAVDRVDSSVNGRDFTTTASLNNRTGIINNAMDVVPATYTVQSTDAIFNPTGHTDFTISSWFYSDTHTTNSAWYGAWTTSTNFLVGNGGPSSTLIFWESSVGAGGPSISISNGEWTHVVIHHDSVADELSITKNAGTPVTISHSAGMAGGSTRFVIGGYNRNQWMVNGAMDEWAFWSRVLTSSERAELYNSGNGIGYPG